jgi:hypothetical protein
MMNSFDSHDQVILPTETVLKESIQEIVTSPKRSYYEVTSLSLTSLIFLRFISLVLLEYIIQQNFN